MNAQQLKFVNSPIESCSLIGNPGCGKTKSIIEFLITKANKKEIKKGKEFLIITFSKMAQEDFYKKGKQSALPKLFTNTNIRTAHSIAQTIYKKLFNSTSDLNTLILGTYYALIQNDIDMSKFPTFANCRVIIVDEAQDINGNQYLLIQQLAKILNVPTILVGDPNQNIYQFQGGSDKYLMNHSETKHVLNINYRSSKAIIDFLNHLRPYANLPNMICGNSNSGTKPIVFNGTVADTQTYIIDMIHSSGYAFEDIAIIGPVKTTAERSDSFGLNVALITLKDNDIPYVAHYNDSKGSERSRRKGFKTKEGHVNILTCHGSKGLEFKMTIVVNFNKGTFNRESITLQDYVQFRYLWYVGLSRAKEKLVICSISTREMFPDLANMPEHLYTPVGATLDNLTSLDVKSLRAESKQIQFPICDTIGSYTFFNENRYLEFKEMQIYSCNNTCIYEVSDTRKSNLVEDDRFAILYGRYMERLFMFYYYKHNGVLTDFIQFLERQGNNYIFLDDTPYYRKLLAGMKADGIVRQDGYCNFDIKTSLLTTQQHNQLMLWRSHVNGDSFANIKIKSLVVEYNQPMYIKMCKQLLDTDTPEEQLFNIIKYIYNVNLERKDLLTYDFQNHLNGLSNYFRDIETLARSYKSLTFEERVTHLNIPLYGNIDCIDNTTGQIIELKFTNQISIQHELQVIMYYNCKYPDWHNPQPMQIINLKQGMQRSLHMNNNCNPWLFNRFLSTVLDTKLTDNIFVLDIETNTKYEFADPFEPANTEIIDRYIYEYNWKCPISAGLVRNDHPISNSEIHGIDETHMDNNAITQTQFQQEMHQIFKICRNPVIIAHNGKRFDFPVMEYHNLLIGGKYNPLDSVSLITHLTNSKADSKQLIDQYNYVFGKQQEQLHRAEPDVRMIVDIMEHYQLKPEHLYDLIER